MELFVHGVYDGLTLQTLLQSGVSRLGFDLRGKSPNLIPFYTLKDLLPKASPLKLYLTFEDDKASTVLSFLDLLGEERNKIQLEFRDLQPPDYYQQFHHPFIWSFHPEADWKGMLSLPQLKAVILPLQWQSSYQATPALWDLIQERNLEVILHLNSFSELEQYKQEKNLCVSVDLGREVECGFRKVDQARLSNLPFWRNVHESSAGQR